MRKEDIIRSLNSLNFNKDHYWLIAGSAMVLYEIREETNDIDLGCTSHLANQLEQKGFPTQYLPDGTRKITYSDTVEIFENWLYDQIHYVEGFPVISLPGLLEMKHFLGRDKDQRDIILIQNYIKKAGSSK